MTNERAVEILNFDLDILGQYGDGTAEAYKMAIKALEAQPCEDCISREAVIQNIKGWFDKIELNPDILIDSIVTLPSVTPRINLAETSQDCISREEVQNLIDRWLSDYLLDETREALETINYKVGDMPPVKPKRPKGKWIKCKSRFGTEYFKCSECGRKLNWIDSDDNYCNSCGSDNSESTKELYKEKLAEISGGSEDANNN